MYYNYGYKWNRHIIRGNYVRIYQIYVSKLNIKQISEHTYFIEYGNSISELVNTFIKSNLIEKLKNIQNTETYNIIKKLFTRYYIF